MKLLIVDDEELTRGGLIHSIDWNALGIDTIFEADDGLHGLEIVKSHSPEIILSDVRMPRMDGVEMAKQIREIQPESSIIFMSGYSDKEYLKAAIKLKAISYVEKPIDLEELKESVKEAILYHKSIVFSRQSADDNRYDNMFQLTLKMIYPNHDPQTDYKSELSQLGLSLKNYSSFATLIIKLLYQTNQQTSMPGSNNGLSISKLEATPIMKQLTPLLKKAKIDFIYGIKQEEYIIVHLLGKDKIQKDMLCTPLEYFSNSLKQSFTHFISLGKAVSNIEKLYESYNNAIILMHSSFFYPYNAVLYNDVEAITYPSFLPSKILSEFSEALMSRNSEKVTQILSKLKTSFVNNKAILVNQVKDLYYKLLLELNESANQFHISISADSTETILDYISKSITFFDLHEILERKTTSFFKSFENENRDNSTIFLIKEFVSENYQNDSLSIKDISEHVFLSSSYVCTIFKTETGKTLNQYLTEYRIEKAKKLLMDSRYKITDISSKVGYNDGNYFGKTFKKQVGLSPSEFREQYFDGKL
ncbi:MAG: response regulator [Candidatus Galacturonibacter soehngenii]|nr:response regulator [Candidatus Galacturonibacter soehngenii]